MCLPQNFQDGHYAKVNPDKTNYFNRARCCNVILLGCSKVGKSLFYHKSDPGLIHCGGYIIRR